MLCERWGLADDQSAASAHYTLVALSIMANIMPEPMTTMVEALDPLSGSPGQHTHNLLERWALRICGIAFTSKSSAVLVNSFGPMAYCVFISIPCA